MIKKYLLQAPWLIVLLVGVILFFGLFLLNGKGNFSGPSVAQADGDYDRFGYDNDGYSRDGYDGNGRDRDGRDRDGRDRDGYDRDGYDKYDNDRNHNKKPGVSIDWEALTSGTTKHLEGVFFVDVNTGWAVGDAGTIRKTTNGGMTWTSQSSGIQDDNRNKNRNEDDDNDDDDDSDHRDDEESDDELNSVYFINADTGWIVGDDGTVLKTTDGGSVWSLKDSNTSRDLNRVFFAATSTGWAVGDGGKIIKTTNGGTSWSSQSSGTDNDLYGVYFANADTGWVVGRGGVIRKTTNGGTSWSSQSSGTSRDLSAVVFADANNGWAVGGNGKIIKTTNGGTSWSSQSSGTTKYLFGVSFTDSNNGWAVGGNGKTLNTINGGTTWTSKASGTTKHLNDVHFVDALTGWAVGNNGVIIRTKAPFNFSLTPTAGTISLVQGESATNIITATRISGIPSSVSYSVSGLPTSTTASVSPTSCTPTCSTALNIHTATSTPAGSYVITITGIGGGVTKTTTFTLAINAIPFDFALFDEGSKSVTAGESVANVITASLSAGTTNSVSFSVSGLPTSTTASFSSASCSPTCSTTLTVSTNSSAPEGNHTITVTAVGGEVAKTTSFALTINAAPPVFDFTVSDLGNRSATAGQTIQNSITAALASGSSTSVTFSASGLPTGATASFSPASCTLSCTTAVSIVTPVTANGGDYTIIVSATGSGLTKTTAFTVTLNEPSTQRSINTVPITTGGAVVLVPTAGSQVLLTIPPSAVSPDGATSLELAARVITSEDPIYAAPPESKVYLSNIFDVSVTKLGATTSSVTSFSAPIAVRIGWDDAALPAGVSDGQIEIGWWDSGNAWHDATSVATWDYVNNQVTYNSDHLTRFALVAAASAATSPPPPPAPVTLPRSSFFVWEIQEGQLIGLRPGCNESADLNSDARVNLIDFSIMAYWRNRSNAPSSLDINQDGKVDVADLSILIYCWVR